MIVRQGVFLEKLVIECLPAVIEGSKKLICRSRSLSALKFVCKGKFVQVFVLAWSKFVSCYGCTIDFKLLRHFVSLPERLNRSFFTTTNWTTHLFLNVDCRGLFLRLGTFKASLKLAKFFIDPIDGFFSFIPFNSAVEAVPLVGSCSKETTYC